MAREHLKPFPDMLHEVKLHGGIDRYKKSIYNAGYTKGILHGIGIVSAAGILIAGSVAVSKKIWNAHKAKAEKTAQEKDEILMALDEEIMEDVLC